MRLERSFERADDQEPIVIAQDVDAHNFARKHIDHRR